MTETYYYSRRKRIPVFQLRSARVVRVPEDRDFVSAPGWRTVPLANKRFQLLIRADLVSERDLQVFRLEQLTGQLLEAEKRIAHQLMAEDERALREELGAQSAPALLGKDGGLLLPTGQVVAKFRPDLDQLAIEREVQSRAGRIVRSLSFLPNTYLLEPMAVGAGLELANSLVEDGVVEFASPNFIEEMPWRVKGPPPNNLFSEQWHLKNVGQKGARQDADVRALEAWQITTGSPDVIICVLDSGIDSKHEAFSTPGKLVPGFDFQDDDFVPDPTTSSHGTSCAGVAGAPWGVGRVVGMAPDCRIMPIRRATLSEHVKMAEAFVWAANHGADVISCSFGYDNRPWVLPDVVRVAIDYAVDKGRNGKGCVIVWAAGNGDEPISTDEWASYGKVIAVGASTDQDLRAAYSDFGPEVYVCAPSSGGRNGITTTSNGGYTNVFGGTSSAAPLVAGIAALLFSVNPNLTWRELRDILRESSERIDAGNGGYDANGHSNWYGYGRVNAFSALHAISALREAVRNSDVEPRLSLIRQLAEELLLPRPAGRQVIEFLSNREFRILELLKSNPGFRQNAVVVLRAAADFYESTKRGGDFVVDEAVWGAIAGIAQLLLPNARESREERNRGGEGRPMAERTTALDEILSRLAEILRGGTSGQPQPAPRTVPVVEADTDQVMKIRELLATELMYMQMIPPLTSDTLLRLDEFVQQLPELLKSLKYRPFMMSQIDSAITLARTQASAGGGVRTAGEDPELTVLAERMGRDIAGVTGERVVPVVALLIGAAVAAAVGGVTIGRAVYEATHGESDKGKSDKK